MAQNLKDVIESLNDLIALDHDAVGAYESAADRVEAIAIREQLRRFQQDHQRHIRELSEIVIQLGGKPKDRPDMKGFFIKGFTAVTSAMGTEAALRAMQGNEELTNRTYRKSLEKEWPENIRAVITRNYQDEQRHLQFIQETLRNHTWETQQPAHP